MTTQPSRSHKILVVGAGALGVVTAVRLALAGHAVTVAVRSPESARTLRAQGLRAEAPDGSIQHAKMPVISSPDELGEPVDLLIVATKAATALAVTRRWIAALAEDGVFVPYQNGLLGDDMARIAGDRLVECAVYYGATLLGPGHSRLTGQGHLHLGPWPRGEAGPGTRTARAASLLAAVVPTYTYTDMLSVKWNKLIANSAMTSLGVLSGFMMRDMMRHAVIRRAFLEVGAESLAIANAAGARAMSLGGTHVGRLLGMPRPLAELALRLATLRQGGYKSSSQQSLERGEPTEVDYLNGRIVEEADTRNLAAPWNAEIVSVVHAIEAGRMTPGLATVRELASRVRSRAQNAKLARDVAA